MKLSYRTFIRIGLLVGGLLLLAVIAAGLYIPSYLESRLIPQSARKFGVTIVRCDVRRAGLSGADLGPVDLRVGDGPGLHIDAVQIDYSPAGLLRRSVNGITISGLNIGISVSEAGIRIAGMPLPAHTGQEKAATRPSGPSPALPIKLGQFKILNTIVDFDWRGKRVQVPLQVDCDTSRSDRGLVNARISLNPRGNPIEMDLELNLETDHISLNLTRAQVLFESIADVTDLVAPAAVSGTLTANGAMRCRLTPFQIEALTLSGQASRFGITFGDWSVGNSTDDDGRVLPLDLALDLEAADLYRWSCGPLAVTGPTSLSLQAINGVASHQDDGLHLTADARINVPAQHLADTASGSMILEKEAATTVHVTANRASDGKIVFSAVSQPETKPRPLRLSIAGSPAMSGAPRWSLNGTCTPEALAIRCNTALSNLSFRPPGGKVYSTDLTVETDATVHFTEGSLETEIRNIASLTNLTADLDTLRTAIPKLSAFVTIKRTDTAPFSIWGKFQLTNASLQHKQNGFSAVKIDASLPFTWPPAAKPRNGSVNIGFMNYQRQMLGGLSGTLVQQGPGLALSAVHQSKLFEGLRVFIEANADASGGTVNVTLPSYQTDETIDLGNFSKAAAGFSVGGRLAAGAWLTWNTAGTTSARARVSLKEGRLEQAENDIMLTGIETELQFDDLMAMRSGPGQKLGIDSIRVGDVTASDLRMNFQVEPEATLFIEKAAVNWCQGMVNTSAVRIKPEVEDYDLTLVCDRLNLAMVLRQLGAAQGNGDGAVSGVIPVHWSTGQLSFNKGFLYSTPGQPGIIQLHDTEFLLAGLPPGSPQHTQLDIATEALKDYTYNWAKLSLESDRETLLIKLQLDGKPNRLLPFAYDQSLGVLKRIQGQGQADFKGIAIDLNFRSPINEILNYKELLKTK